MLIRLGLAFATLASLSAFAQDDPVFRSLHHEVSGTGTATHVAIGNLNGDQVPDIVFTTANSVRLGRGRGDGSFILEPATLVAGLGPDDVVLADFDLDGDLDLATPGTLKTVKVALGHGNFTFEPTQTYATDGFPTRLVVADITGDGLPDLVASNESGLRFDVLPGVGGGLFGASQSFGPTVEDPYFVAAGDFDGDGDLDVATASSAGTNVVVLHNSGAGSFGGPISASLGHQTFAITSADLNEDGRDDLLCAGFGILMVVLADPGGGFLPTTTLSLGGMVAPSLATADFDEDGHLDVVVLVASAANILRGHGDGSLETPVVAPTGYGEFGLAVGDLNVDGETDLLAIAGNFNGLTTVLHRGDLVFGPSTAMGKGPVGLVLADFDEDGRLDMATADKDAKTVSLRLGLGNGWFGTRSTLSSSADVPWFLVSGDFNSDGHADLAAANHQSPSSVQVWLGDGEGGFGATATYPVGDQLVDLAAGDMNGDGAPDLLVVSALHQELQVLFNAGVGTFLPLTSFPLAPSPKALVLGDLDEDGSLDVATVHSLAEGSVQVHLNDGNGSLLPAVPLAGGTIQLGLACADVDGDGHLDLIGTDPAGVAAATLHGHGDGSFDAPVVLGTAVQSVGTTVGDVDGDDVPDVLAWHQTSSSAGSLGLFRGLGGGAFAAEEVSQSPAGPMEVQIGDLDQDGVADAALSIPGASQVQVLLSRRGPWDDLLKPLAGSTGFAHQTGEGTLVGGQHFSFTLTDARPSALCWQVVGLAALNAPFKGGTLVPFPTLLVGPLVTNAQGQLVLAGNWPNGVPSGVALYLQFWIQDIGGPAGFAASNALRATMP